MELLRLSTQRIEFEYNKFDNMVSNITLFNDSQQFVAFKFKATNMNIFLVRPPMGIVHPKQSIIITITLHCKVLENNSIHDFNEKLQLITTSIPNIIQDVGVIFIDQMRNFEKQRINVAIITKDKQIVAQSHGSQAQNQMFTSVNKQFGNMEPTRVVAIPSPEKSRSEAEYFNNRYELLQQEIQNKEIELQNVKKENAMLQQKQKSKKSTLLIDFILIIVLLVVIFGITTRIDWSSYVRI